MAEPTTQQKTSRKKSRSQGNSKKNWKVVERKAEYENVFANERKEYLIKEL